MKTRRPVTLPDDDRTISICFTSGKAICLRPSELTACELVARVLRGKASGQRAFRIIGAPWKPKEPKLR